MRRIPTIKTVMTPFPYAVAIDASLATATELMDQHQIRHLPVIDREILKGVISDRDIKLLVGADSELAQELTVRTAYTPDPCVVDLNERLDNVALTMAQQHIGSALITKNRKLVGIFTGTDACRWLAHYLREQFGPNDGDEAA